MISKKEYEQIKELLAEKEKLVLKKFILTKPTDDICLITNVYNECRYISNDKFSLNDSEILILKSHIEKEIENIDNKLNGVGYYE